jgi:hypothetical protein
VELVVGVNEEVSRGSGMAFDLEFIIIVVVVLKEDWSSALFLGFRLLTFLGLFLAFLGLFLAFLGHFLASGLLVELDTWSSNELLGINAFQELLDGLTIVKLVLLWAVSGMLDNNSVELNTVFSKLSVPGALELTLLALCDFLLSFLGIFLRRLGLLLLRLGFFLLWLRFAVLWLTLSLCPVTWLLKEYKCWILFESLDLLLHVAYLNSVLLHDKGVELAFVVRAEATIDDVRFLPGWLFLWRASDSSAFLTTILIDFWFFLWEAFHLLCDFFSTDELGYGSLEFSVWSDMEFAKNHCVWHALEWAFAFLGLLHVWLSLTLLFWMRAVLLLCWFGLIILSLSLRFFLWFVVISRTDAQELWLWMLGSKRRGCKKECKDKHYFHFKYYKYQIYNLH